MLLEREQPRQEGAALIIAGELLLVRLVSDHLIVGLFDGASELVAAMSLDAFIRLDMDLDLFTTLDCVSAVPPTARPVS